MMTTYDVAVSEAFVERDESPERRLWRAVLAQAVKDALGIYQGEGLCTDSGGPMKLAAQARIWFSLDLDDIGSFAWVCHMLGIDAVRFRRGVLSRTRKLPSEGEMRRFAKAPLKPPKKPGKLKAGKLRPKNPNASA